MHKVALVVLVALILAGCGTIDVAGNNAPPYTDPGTSLPAAKGPGPKPAGCHMRGRGLFALPDPRCSPGEVNSSVQQANVNATICKRGWTRTIRPREKVTNPEKRVEMRAYGIGGSSHGYEFDHIISLELGGAANSYANYWPEPDYPGRHGYYLNPKDRLENALNDLVCAHKMSLRVAQRDVSTDWAAAYRRYVK